MLRGLSWAVLAIALTSLDVGCTLDELDPTGKECPCPSGFACVAGLCQRGGTAADATGAGAGTGTTAVSSSGAATGAGAGVTTGTSTSTGTGGTSACADVCGTPGCGMCPTPQVVAIDAYDIDAYEVTAAGYQAFLDTHPDATNQPSVCKWNDRFGPSADDLGCPELPDASAWPNRPMVCVDWCDARAYCAWAKRHLCGRIGGGALLEGKGTDATQSEWFRACTKAGTQAYPYGNTFVSDRCNTNGSFGGSPFEVGSSQDCVGGYSGLFDMSGNVQEWEDACGTGVDADDPADDGCPGRGGAFWTGEEDSRCDGLNYAPTRETLSGDFGFRCCGPTG